MKNKYLIRLDDACPYMDRAKWQRMEDILDKYGVKPLVGIIPANADPKTMIELEDPTFWEKAHSWERKGWLIALHGYDHVCISDGGMKGLNPFWKRSEFAGLPLERQREKIKTGINILKQHGFEPKYFFAPSHTFDENTLKALKAVTDIRIISDTISLKPYKRGDFVFVPQISGHCSKMPINGVYTFCFHPNTMKDEDFESVEAFIKIHKSSFVGFNELDLTRLSNIDTLSAFLQTSFFTYRKIRGLS